MKKLIISVAALALGLVTALGITGTASAVNGVSVQAQTSYVNVNGINVNGI